jgi:hypothetical protein
VHKQPVDNDVRGVSDDPPRDMKAKFVCDRTRVGDVTVPRHAVADEGESIEIMRANVAQHIAARYKVPVSRVLPRVRLAWTDVDEASGVDDYVARGMSHSLSATP